MTGREAVDAPAAATTRPTARRNAMRYMLLICEDKNAPAPPEKDMGAIVQGHMNVAQELHRAGKMVVGERLRGDGETSRVRIKAGQRQVTDGPLAGREEGPGRSE